MPSPYRSDLVPSILLIEIRIPISQFLITSVLFTDVIAVRCAFSMIAYTSLCKSSDILYLIKSFIIYSFRSHAELFYTVTTYRFIILISDNLLQQARALYQSWFIDYDPFDGERPSTWIDDTIDGLAKEIICGKTPSTKVSEYYGNDIPFITIPDMYGNIYAVTTERYLSSYGAESQHKKTLPRNSICVSCIGTAGLVTLTSQESQTNQQINSIIPKENFSPYYIYLLMETLSIIINNLGQSGSTIVNLNKAQFGKIPVVIPSIETMKSFDEVVCPMFESILSNQEENIKLTELRDSLLPRLMSGELDVSDIDI